MKASRAASLVVGVRVRVAHEDPVLDGDRGQVAGANADEGVARPLLLLLLVGDRPVLRPPRLPEGQVRREEVVLPGVRADVEAEERLVVALVEPVGAALLLVGQPLGQVGGRGDLLVDDRPVADRRADHRVAPLGQSCDQVVERSASDHGRGSRAHSGEEYASHHPAARDRQAVRLAPWRGPISAPPSRTPRSIT